jgi:hypothetical protein
MSLKQLFFVSTKPGSPLNALRDDSGGDQASGFVTGQALANFAFATGFIKGLWLIADEASGNNAWFDRPWFPLILAGLWGLLQVLWTFGTESGLNKWTRAAVGLFAMFNVGVLWGAALGIGEAADKVTA